MLTIRNLCRLCGRAPFLFLSLTAAAVPGFEKRQFYYGVRALGMGNSAVAVANDETALLHNPAGLGKLRDFYGTYFDPEIEINNNGINMYRLAPFSAITSPSAVIPAAVAAQGDYYHGRTTLFPSLVARNFGIGLLLKSTLDVRANSSSSVDVNHIDDIGLILGYNFRFFDGIVKLGFAGKIINRIEVDSNINPSAGTDLVTLAAADKAKEGTGLGVDVGLLVTGPWAWLPTIGVVARDLGGTKFDKMNDLRLAPATSNPKDLPQDADAGIALFPIHNKNLRSVWTIEYKNLLTSANETDKAKHVHGGLEVNVADILFVRAGYNQRYWTAGFELASENFQFQLASYGEEVGDQASTLEDRRYTMKLAFRF
ncbi:MAG: hypothetical protein N2578_00385 [Bdellovibrionaceae bacterium]|nr:hypothetical protein [Pseudobdellovibrionaceae bacterium]